MPKKNKEVSTVVNKEEKMLPAEQKKAGAVLLELVAKKIELPSVMHQKRFMLSLGSQMVKIPKLATCDSMSFLESAFHAAHLGMEIGHDCYILPFNSKHSSKPKAQLIMGVRGNLALLSRSEGYYFDAPVVVYENDKFIPPEIKNGKMDWAFKQASGDRGKVMGCFMVWGRVGHNRDQVKYMSLVEIKELRTRAEVRENAIFKKFPEALVRKTLIYYVSKEVPSTAISNMDREIIVASCQVLPEEGDIRGHLGWGDEGNNVKSRANEMLNRDVEETVVNPSDSSEEEGDGDDKDNF